MVQRFGDIFEIIDGDRGKNYPQDKDFFDSGYCLFLSANNVTKDGWRFDKCQFITNEKSKILRKGLVSRGDIIFTSRGTVGNVALYDESVSYDVVRINSGMVILREKDANNIYNKYAYYILKSPSTKQLIAYYCSGSAQPQLPIKDFVKIKVDIPLLPIQRKIASILSTYDNLIENNTKRIKLLEQMAENLYKEWFVRFRFPGHENVEMENGLPKGWKHVKFGELSPIVTGKKDANFASPKGKYKFFTCSKDDLSADSYSFDCFAIILAGNGDLNVKLYKGQFEAYQRTYVLSPFDLKHIFVSFYTIKSELDRLLIGAAGAVIKFLTKGMIENIKVLIPDKTTLQTFNEIMQKNYDMRQNLIKQNEYLSKQRDLLLPRLMSGKLEVNIENCGK